MNHDTFPYCCGVVNIGGFRSHDHDRIPTSGTGFLVGTFTDTDACRAAYERLSVERSVHAQTKPLTNRNSGRKVFVAVFGPKRKLPVAAERAPARTVHHPAIARLAPQAPYFAPQRRGEKLPR